jgi:hypothetical protein
MATRRAIAQREMQLSPTGLGLDVTQEPTSGRGGEVLSVGTDLVLLASP